MRKLDLVAIALALVIALKEQLAMFEHSNQAGDQKGFRNDNEPSAPTERQIQWVRLAGQG